MDSQQKNLRYLITELDELNLLQNNEKPLNGMFGGKSEYPKQNSEIIKTNLNELEEIKGKIFEDYKEADCKNEEHCVNENAKNIIDLKPLDKSNQKLESKDSESMDQDDNIHYHRKLMKEEWRVKYLKKIYKN